MSKSIPHLYPIRGEPCQALEIVNNGSDKPYLEPHRHEYWEIVWCMDDAGIDSIDFVDFPHKSGRLFTIAPGQVHKFEQAKNCVRLLTFTPGYLEVDHRSMQLVEKVFAVHEDRLPYLDCSEEGIAYLDPIFTMIQEERQRATCDWDLVKSLVHCFLRYVLRFSQSEMNTEKKDVRVSQLVNLIELHYREQKGCQFYADALALTCKRLNEIVKAEKNKSVTQLIHDRVILEANRSLVFSMKTVKTISIELGYEDPAYFSRFYRKQMHESPASFRARCADSAT